MSNKQGLEARNQQAARDALRRRQKAKKAKQVKRHVRYKEKKKLLSELEAEKVDVPIVAHELGRPGDEEDEEGEIAVQPLRQRQTQERKRTRRNSDKAEATKEAEDNEVAEDIDSQDGGMNDEIQSAQKQEPEEKSIPSVVVEKRKPKKYLPFTKQMKQAEQARKERQKNEKEREIKIKTRENRLKLSKKERRKRVSCIVYNVASAVCWEGETSRKFNSITLLLTWHISGNMLTIFDSFLGFPCVHLVIS